MPDPLASALDGEDFDVGGGFDEFYRREFPAMLALAAAITNGTIAAEDIAQEALVRAYKKWDSVGHYDKPGAWLRRVTINLALSKRRKVASDLKARLSQPRPTIMHSSPERFDDVWVAVTKLPNKQRAAVALHYLEDRPVSELAEILECSESTARVHLHRGRSALASLLGGAES